ncbi:hypothetical protein FOFC_12320 [Fusarium oxysporum]|nr:hypothetical protein FOFC_12320 [Fusarium oxysporum]
MIRLAHLLVKNVVVLHRVATALRIELPPIPVDEFHVRLSNSKAPKIRKRLKVDIYVSLLRCC